MDFPSREAHQLGGRGCRVFTTADPAGPVGAAIADCPSDKLLVGIEQIQTGNSVGRSQDFLASHTGRAFQLGNREPKPLAGWKFDVFVLWHQTDSVTTT